MLLDVSTKVLICQISLPKPLACDFLNIMRMRLQICISEVLNCLILKEILIMRNCPKPLGCDVFYCSVCLGGRKDDYNEYILPEVCRRDPSLTHPQL